MKFFEQKMTLKWTSSDSVAIKFDTVGHELTHAAVIVDDIVGGSDRDAEKKADLHFYVSLSKSFVRQISSAIWEFKGQMHFSHDFENFYKMKSLKTILKTGFIMT